MKKLWKRILSILLVVSFIVTTRAIIPARAAELAGNIVTNIIDGEKYKFRFVQNDQYMDVTGTKDYKNDGHKERSFIITSKLAARRFPILSPSEAKSTPILRMTTMFLRAILLI